MKLLRLVIIGVLLISAPTMILAQDEGPRYINLRVVTVKPDQLAQWESVMKERSEVVQEAGQAFFHIFARQRGPLDTYLIITPGTTIGGPATGVPGSQNWVTALRNTLASQSLNTLQTYPEASTDPTRSVHPGANFMHARLRTVAAGRNQDYETWLTDELIPALREAEVGDVRTFRSVLGGSPRTWVTLSFVDGWPPTGDIDLDDRMLARGDAMVVAQTDYFYTFREDLSFTSGVAVSSTDR